ncbi:MAG TPA: acyl carrier protein [Thermotogota bacterium]|nr:acyl carrier protein [Thermotogota bacterium]
MNEEQKFLEGISEILEVETDEISLDTDFRKEIPFWDSLKGFGILVYLEEDYNKKLSVDEFMEQKTIGDLFQQAMG